MKFEIVLTADEAKSFILSPIALHSDAFNIANQLRKQMPCDAKVADAVWITKDGVRQTACIQTLVETTPMFWLTRSESEPSWGRWWEKSQYSIERA